MSDESLWRAAWRNENSRVVLLVVMIAAGVFACGPLVRWSAEAEIRTLLHERGPKADSSSVAHATLLAATAPTTARLSALVTEARKRKAYHREALSFFYSEYYSTVVLGQGSAVIAGALLILFAKVGWDQAGRYLKTALLLFSGLSVFYSPRSNVYRQVENAKTSSDLYVRYENLEHSLLSYLATGPDPADSLSRPDLVVRRATDSLAAMNTLAVEFDPSRLADPLKALSLESAAGTR